MGGARIARGWFLERWADLQCICTVSFAADLVTDPDDARLLDQLADAALLTLGHYTLQQHRNWTRFGRVLLGLQATLWCPPSGCVLSGLMRHVVDQLLAAGR